MRLIFVMIALLLSALLHATPKVVVSIKPVHSLVSGIMKGLAKPHLLVPEGASSHTYQLSPSNAIALSSADMIIWVGPEYESFLIKSLENVAPSVITLSLITSPNIQLHKLREGASWETHEHHDHSAVIDPHIWLNPQNAISIVQTIATALCAQDPSHASIYRQNASQLTQRLIKLDQSLANRLKHLQKRPFLVFHDGLQYFEKRYHLLGVGAILLNPQVPPSAKHLHVLRQRLMQQQVVCVLREPEFSAAILHSLTEGSSVKQAPIDTLAVFPALGEEAYFSMMEKLGQALETCLSP